MKRMSEQEIMSASKPEDIFSMRLETIEQEKEEYLERFKPKEYRSIQNFVITKRVIMLYNQAISELKNQDNNDLNLGMMCIKSVAGEEYKIHYISNSGFKLGEMYLTAQYVIYIVRSSYKKYYENYIEKTKKYSKPDRKVWNIVEYMLPNVEKHFETIDGNFAIFVKKPCEMYSLKEILEYFDGKLKPEYVASILTRLYYFTCYMGLVEMTHNAITLDNLFFAPGREIEEGKNYTVNDMRIVGVFGGWFFTTYFEEELKGIPKEVYDIMPKQCRERGYSSFEVDELSIRKLAGELLGAEINNAPKPFFNWVNETNIAKDSYKEFCNWENVVISSFGEHRFVDMHVSI